MRDMAWWDFPGTFVAQAALGADVATILGAAGVIVVARVGLSIRASLRASVHFQQQEAISRALATAGISATGSTQKVISAILHWARNERYPHGFSKAELDELPIADREQYFRWVAHMVLLFELIELDPLWEADQTTRDQVRALLDRHAPALTAPHFSASYAGKAIKEVARKAVKRAERR